MATTASVKAAKTGRNRRIIVVLRIGNALGRKTRTGPEVPLTNLIWR
jgi:hypothetical protein